MVGSLKMNTALEYSTRVVQEGDRRCKKSTLNDLAYLSPLRIPLMNPVTVCIYCTLGRGRGGRRSERRYSRRATVHKYCSFIHWGNTSQPGSKIETTE